MHFLPGAILYTVWLSSIVCGITMSFGRFEKIAAVVPQLDVEGKYKRILARFHQEIEKVSRIYCRQCESPPQLRGLPPVSGEGTSAMLCQL